MSSTQVLCAVQEMRTYVALSNETVAAAHAGTSGSQEVWGYWPDDEPLKGLHPGDTRAALTPFLAHEVWACHMAMTHIAWSILAGYC